MNNKIGEMLRRYRKQNHMDVADVAVELKERYNLKVAEKTIYGWESNQSHPTTDTFVLLCELYQIRNLRDALDMQERTAEIPKFQISKEERKLIEAYRSHPDMQQVVDKLLDVEPAVRKRTNRSNTYNNKQLHN